MVRSDVSKRTCYKGHPADRVVAGLRAALPSMPEVVSREAVEDAAGIACAQDLMRWVCGAGPWSLPPCDAGDRRSSLRSTIEAWARGDVDGSPARPGRERMRTALPDDLAAWHLHPDRPDSKSIRGAEKRLAAEAGRGHYRTPMSKDLRTHVDHLPTLDLAQIEAAACAVALSRAGSILAAAGLLGITRHALKRRMLKHGLGLRATIEPANPVNPS